MTGNGTAPLPPAGTDLSKREVDIIVLLADGSSNREIGEVLGLSANTIKTHLRRIQAKLEARTRAQVVHHAHVRKLL